MVYLRSLRWKARSRRYALILNLSFLVLMTGSVSAQQNSTTDKKIFDVAVEISDQSRIIGKPHLIIKDESVATIVADRPDGYSIRATLEYSPDGRPEFRKISAELYLAENGQWVQIGRPFIVSAINRSSNLIMQRPGRSDVMMKITIKDSFKELLSDKNKKFGRNACSLAKLENWQQRMIMPVAMILPAAQEVQLGGSGCCSAGCELTCCSDGPICGGDYNCPGFGCCN